MRAGKLPKQFLFDRLGRDIVAGTENNQVFQPADDAPVARAIHFALVTGMEPTIAQDSGSFLRPVPIAGEDIGAAHQDLLGFAQSHLDAINRGANAACGDAPRIVHRTDRRGFSQPVHLQHGHAQHLEKKLRLFG